MHHESNVIGNTWATDSWEERCDLSGPLLWVHSWGCSGVLGASWGDLVAFWDGLGPSWGDLGASWDGLGASWGDLRASGGVLGASRGGLGASWKGRWGVCWHNLIFYNFLVRFWTDLEAQMGPQRSPKWSPKWIKINDKS